MNVIYDEVRLLRSRTTGKIFPHVVFSGDTDMVTLGWVSLTSIEVNEVFVTEVNADEWRSLSHGIEGHLQLERRINLRLGRTDLRCPWIVRVEDRGPSAKGLSFQEFRKIYQPLKIFYRDIHDASSEAEEVAVVGREEFESGGGKLVVVS